MLHTRGNILVVDDDEDLREQICKLLSAGGHEVAGVSNGVAALRLLNGGAVDLILFDLNMPLMDGWEFRSQLKQIPGLARIPLLAISADRRSKARAIPADEFLLKPFGVDELETAVERLLAVRRGGLSTDTAPSPSSWPIGTATTARYRANDVIATRYRLVEPLGEGGMGTVWLARNLTLDTDVAVKLIRRGVASPVALELLLHEARAAAKLEHPHIVKVFDFGETEGRDPFIVMEVLKGESFADVVSRRRRLPAQEAVQLLLPLAGALALAHDKGIVHRDLKPENIVLSTEETGRLVPKLVDFGVAKIHYDDAEGRIAIYGCGPIGSPQYMSPEQAVGSADVDGRSDVWSLAVVLYEAIVGHRPFEGDELCHLIDAILEGEVTPATESGAADEVLWRIIERGLAKGPGDRWPTMRDFGRALAEWALDHGVDADASGNAIACHWFGQGGLAPASEPRPAPQLIAPASSEPGSLQNGAGGSESGVVTIQRAPEPSSQESPTWRERQTVSLRASSSADARPTLMLCSDPLLRLDHG